ncbi:MAG: hypothetical protein V8T86_02050 [Victivallis sp.]
MPLPGPAADSAPNRISAKSGEMMPRSIQRGMTKATGRSVTGPSSFSACSTLQTRKPPRGTAVSTSASTSSRSARWTVWRLHPVVCSKVRIEGRYCRSGVPRSTIWRRIFCRTSWTLFLKTDISPCR